MEEVEVGGVEADLEDVGVEAEAEAEVEVGGAEVEVGAAKHAVEVAAAKVGVAEEEEEVNLLDIHGNGPVATLAVAVRRLGWVDDRHANLAVGKDIRMEERFAIDRHELESRRALRVLGRERKPPREDARVPHRRLPRRDLPTRRLAISAAARSGVHGASATHSNLPLEKVLSAVRLCDRLRDKHERVVLAPALPLFAEPVLGCHRPLPAMPCLVDKFCALFGTVI